MKTACYWAIALLVGFGQATAAPAETFFRRGELAPPLNVGRWLRGEPVEHFQKGTVYVVEFWATWCGPCISVMPHIQALQDRYEDEGLVVIGVNVREYDADAVDKFVDKDRHSFRLVSDATPPEYKEGFMKRTWLDASGSPGIPTSFIVDAQGRIAWFGHPLLLDAPLAAVLNGTYDDATEQARIVNFIRLDEELGRCMRGKDWKAGLDVLDQMDSVAPTISYLNYGTRLRFLLQLGRTEEALALANKIVSGDPKMTTKTTVVDTLLKAPDNVEIDPEFMLSLARAGAGDGLSDEPMALSVLARAYDRAGRYSEALATWRALQALDHPMVDTESLHTRIEQLEAKIHTKSGDAQ